MDTINKLSQKTGKLPGDLSPIGISDQLPSKFTITYVNENTFDKQQHKSFSKETLENIDGKTCWINVKSLMGTNSLKNLFEHFELHPLLQEDLFNLKSIAKVDHSSDSSILILKQLVVNDNKISTKQLSFIFNNKTLATLQVDYENAFSSIEEQLSLIKKDISPQYLFYLLLDNLVDSNYKILEKLSDELKYTQHSLISTDAALSCEDIIHYSDFTMTISSNLYKTKTVLQELFASRIINWDPSLKIHFRDINNHLDQLIEMSANCTKMFEDVKELQARAEGLNSTNIMRVFAFVSIIFFPLIFITNIYSMNFKYMPELNSVLGYPICLTILAIVSLMTYYIFRKKYF